MANFLPQDGWTEHPERVDQTLSILSRIPFTVSFEIIIHEGNVCYFWSEISDLMHKVGLQSEISDDYIYIEIIY